MLTKISTAYLTSPHVCFVYSVYLKNFRADISSSNQWPIRPTFLFSFFYQNEHSLAHFSFGEVSWVNWRTKNSFLSSRPWCIHEFPFYFCSLSSFDDCLCYFFTSSLFSLIWFMKGKKRCKKRARNERKATNDGLKWELITPLSCHSFILVVFPPSSHFSSTRRLSVFAFCTISVVFFLLSFFPSLCFQCSVDLKRLSLSHEQSWILHFYILYSTFSVLLFLLIPFRFFLSNRGNVVDDSFIGISHIRRVRSYSLLFKIFYNK